MKYKRINFWDKIEKLYDDDCEFVVYDPALPNNFDYRTGRIWELKEYIVEIIRTYSDWKDCIVQAISVYNEVVATFHLKDENLQEEMVLAGIQYYRIWDKCNKCWVDEDYLIKKECDDLQDSVMQEDGIESDLDFYDHYKIVAYDCFYNEIKE